MIRGRKINVYPVFMYSLKNLGLKAKKFLTRLKSFLLFVTFF